MQETSLHALPLPNHLPAPKKKKKINAKERKGFCWLYVLLKCGPARVRPSSWERGEGEMGVDWETSSSHSVPCTAPYESQLGSWSSTISNVILPSGNLNVFIMMSSAQVFPIKDFSMYYLTCYSTKTWVHGPLPLENLSEFIYLNMSLFSVQPTNSVRAGTLFCPPFYRPGAWMSV